MEMIGPIVDDQCHVVRHVREALDDHMFPAARHARVTVHPIREVSNLRIPCCRLYEMWMLHNVARGLVVEHLTLNND